MSQAVLISALALLGAGSVWAQSTFGEFTGTVHDPGGSVIALCVVKATNVGTSAARSVVTDSS